MSRTAGYVSDFDGSQGFSTKRIGIFRMALSTRLTAVLLVSLCADSAHAAGFFRCDDGNQYTRTTSVSSAAKWKVRFLQFNLNSTSFPSGSPYGNAALQAIRRWDQSPQDLQFVSVGNGSRITQTMDDDNGASFIASSGPCSSTALACTPIRYSCEEGIQEFDIFFVSNDNYTTSERKSDLFAYGGGQFNFHQVMMHEIGHAIGLAHTSSVYNLMGDSFRHALTNSATAQTNVGADSTAGAVRLYGTRPDGRGGVFTGENVSVSHWRWCGTAPGGTNPISQHCYTRVFDASTGRLQPWGIGVADGTQFRANLQSSELIFDVRIGQQVQLELSYENTGRHDQAPLVRYYLSTNDNVTSSDLQIGPSRSLSLTRGGPRLRRTTLTIPDRTKQGTPLQVGGTYFLGAMVDADGRISEVDERNATYVPIRIVR